MAEEIELLDLVLGLGFFAIMCLVFSIPMIIATIEEKRQYNETLKKFEKGEYK